MQSALCLLVLGILGFFKTETEMFYYLAQAKSIFHCLFICPNLRNQIISIYCTSTPNIKAWPTPPDVP